MKKLAFAAILLLACQPIMAQNNKLVTKTLANGLKMIVCEKPDNQFVEVEVWYRVGSKDEKPGIRGMAHLFEHMMFRGTKKYPGNAIFENIERVGGTNNAYTTFDRTVYHEYMPASALELTLDLEADRMNNLVVTQDILNTERQVVGEELRNGQNNWYQKMNSDRYPFLYPSGHPYEVDVIGNLNEITAFTSEQCMQFYNNYYSPNNAFLVVVGNVKADEVFALADKYFGVIKKQLDIKPAQNVPDLTNAKIRTNDMPIDYPVQIYSFVYPRPDVGSKDFFAVNMLTNILFTESNSILNNRLVKKEHSVYLINNSADDWSLYPNMGVIDVIMQANPGNIKVKRAIRTEIDKIIAEGVNTDIINQYIQAMDSQYQQGLYTCEGIAANLGQAEYYLKDYNKANTMVDEFKKITSDDLKRIATTYFAEDKMQFINVKPGF